jgi:riboflavin synthase
MFTGLISDLGRVRRIEARGDRRFEFATAYDTATLDLGASVACSGACLTVVDKGPGWFAADVSAETLARTTLGDWGVGTPVNLERSLRLGDELGGHLVSGHVDGVGTLRERRPDGDSLRFAFAAPSELLALVAVKGSIAVDGVSLTVNAVRDAPREASREASPGHAAVGSFEVNVIPHTAQATTLGDAEPGTRVNLEIDLLARYVQRILATR